MGGDGLSAGQVDVALRLGRAQHAVNLTLAVGSRLGWAWRPRGLAPPLAATRSQGPPDSARWWQPPSCPSAVGQAGRPSSWRARPSTTATQRPPHSPTKATGQLLPGGQGPWAGPPAWLSGPRGGQPGHRGGALGTWAPSLPHPGNRPQEAGRGLRPGAPQLGQGCPPVPTPEPSPPLRPAVTSWAQLLRAIVSTTCSSLLRSRCRRACSSFSRAARICGSGSRSGAGLAAPKVGQQQSH